MNLRPKKSLGQNFLIDSNILDYICHLGKINNNSTIIEIGPGTGNLTEKILLQNPKEVIVIEKDKKLSSILENKFSKKIKIINDDFLNFPLKDFNRKDLVIYGNLPYNISTEILIKIVKSLNSFTFRRIIFMFQKEVADRIIAQKNTKNYGRLSIVTQWRLNITKLKEISPNCFYPKPKVLSTVLEFTLKKEFKEINKLNNLEHISRIFFNHRRKMIKKPITKLFKNPKILTDKININLNDRPQKLEPEVYYEICRVYENLIK